VRFALALALALGCSPRRTAAPTPRAVAAEDALYTLLERDAIPSLDAPAFVSAAEVSLPPDAPVAGVLTPAEEARAYPLTTLERHEVVNDTYGVVGVAVTYSPLTGSVAAYLRPIAEGKVTSLGVSGKLYRDAGVLYDRATESLWSQFDGACLAGPSQGARLESYPATTATWEAWLRMHPETRVLSGPHPAASAYDEYRAGDRLGVTGAGAADPRLPPKTRVLGVRIGAGARAYPLDALPEKLEDTVGGQLVVILAHPGGARASMLRPEASRLPAAPGAITAYWFAWARFYPQTELWSPLRAKD
jgi:hypothetical protein